MKKKIFSLLLIVCLMMSLTIASFASDASLESAGESELLRLSPGKTEDMYLHSKDMDKYDKDMKILVSLDGYPDAQFLFELYDQTTSQRVLLKSFSGESAYYDWEDILDPTHDYKILITNLGSSYFKGHIFIIAY